MSEAESARERNAARRERDYLRYLAYQEQQASPEREPTPEAPYKLACEVLGIDYEDIERRAAELIDNHDYRPKTEWQGEYEDNARTVLFEVLTESAHLSTVEFRGTPEEVNSKTLERFLNGVQPGLPDYEASRRFREICEELIIQEAQAQVLAGRLPPDTHIATESPYVVGVSNEEAQRMGYRWRNKKGMVRSTGFIIHGDGTITRRVEQISYSNSSAHESILRRHEEGIATPRENKADVDLLGSQLLFSLKDMQEGVIGIQRRIDAYAGEGVRFGALPKDVTPSYENLREVSAERESHIEEFVTQLADFEHELDRRLKAGDITQPEHSRLYAKEVRTIVKTICVLQPEYTKDALGEAVVDKYYEANKYMSAGDDTAAAVAVESVAHLEQEISACGVYAPPSSNPETSPEDDALRNKLRNVKESWIWRPGVCRVDNCPTDGARVKVGPCMVCKGCQKHYDVGRDPFKVYAKRTQESSNKPTEDSEIPQVVVKSSIRFDEIKQVGDAELIAIEDGIVIAEGVAARELKKELAHQAYALAS